MTSQSAPPADRLRASYDAAPYDSWPITASHIDRLATIARLHGIAAPGADRCRVLEIGCGTGGNLLPLALEFPQSTFLGTDFSSAQIAIGERERAVIGISNLRLEPTNVEDLDASAGEFDYIICHGVFSWVPPRVQDAILRVCSTNLAPNGVAYVSYNVYPGWHVRMIVREILLANDDADLPPSERVARARSLAASLEQASAGKSDPYRKGLFEEMRAIRYQHDSYVLHEQLEDVNSPISFSDFMRRAERCQLQFLSEAKWFHRTVSIREERPDGDAPVDWLRAEQLSDYVVGRTFRETLLCHDGVAVNRQLDTTVVRAMRAVISAARVATAGDAPATTGALETFRSADGGEISTEHPLVSAIIHTLGEAEPAALPFDDIVAGARRRLAERAAPVAEHDETEVAEVVVRLASAGLITLRSTSPGFVAHVSRRPTASPLARLQARRGRFVSSLTHRQIALSALEQTLMPLLDGTRDRHALIDIVAAEIAAGRLTASAEMSGGDAVAHAVDGLLRRLCMVGLLVA